MSSKKTGFIALPFAVLLGLAGCAEDTVVQEAQEEGPVAESAILGETVTLQSEVQRVIGPNAFTVGEDETLIIGSGMTDQLQDGDQVQVSGTVRNFVVAEVETDHGVAFNDDEAELLIEYEQDLAVVADEVQELAQ